MDAPPSASRSEVARSANGHAQERGSGRDATGAIVAFLVLLFGIPSVLIVGPLGAAGTPAAIVAVVFFVWWSGSQLLLPMRPVLRNPVHWLLGVFAVTLLASYVVGMSRPISGVEVNSSDRALISLVAWCGIVLVISNGVESRDRAFTLLRVIAASAAVIALLGMLQFFFALDLAQYVRIPGLTANSAVGTLFDRSGFRRVSGTTAHPIEFGAVLSATLPVVLHCARFAPSAVERRRWWIATIVVASVLPMSVARSAIVGGIVVALILVPTWPRVLQLKAVLVGLVGLVVMSGAVPGLLGTIKGLFLNAGSDPSTKGRTDDYGPVLQYVRDSPLEGRGVGTFIPELYRTLDNQYLGILVEAGVLGLGCLLALLVGTMIVAGVVRHRASDPAERDLALSLMAGIAVVVVNTAFFDSFGFPMCVGILFVLVGLVGLLYKFSSARTDSRGVGRDGPGTPRGRHRAVPILVAVVVLTSWGTSAAAIVTRTDSYEAIGNMLLVPPQTRDRPAFDRSGEADLAASVLKDTMDTDGARSQLAESYAGDYEIAVGEGSLYPGTDKIGFGPSLRFIARAQDPEDAAGLLAGVMAETDRVLAQLQTGSGVPRQSIIQTREVQQSPYFVSGRPAKSLVGFVALSLLISFMAATAERTRRQWRRTRAAALG